MTRTAMTTREVMHLLNVRHPDTLYALVRSKRLPAIRLGREYRFDPVAVESFLRGETPVQAEQRARRKATAGPAWMDGVKREIRR